MSVVGLILELTFDALPYVLCAAAGAYLESKYGSKLSAEVAALKAELAALKAKL